MVWKVNPLEGKTINRRAGCGKTASPVRREGGPKPIGPPYPYPRQKPRRLYIFLAQGPFPACARTRALPRTARQMPKQISPSPFMKRGQGGEVSCCQGGKARSSSGHSVSRLRQRPRRSRTGLSAPMRARCQRGGSPRHGVLLWPREAEGNCVAARRGGEQPEANCWPVGVRILRWPDARGEPAEQRRSLLKAPGRTQATWRLQSGIAWGG